MAIQLTESAARKIREGLDKEGLAEGGLRLGIKGGGCSGLNYVLRFEAGQRPGDKVFEAHGVRLFVDFKSLLYLKGTTLDWQGDLMQQGFTFVNPNARKTCSCGISFTV
jgi:iron-sulfur cluster assembly protein